MKDFLNKLGYNQEIEYSERLLYFMNLCAILVAFLFLVLYFCYVRFLPAIIAQSLYISGSVSIFIFLKQRKFALVRVLLVVFHMVQLTFSVFVWFPFSIGFNLFYFMVPMTAFTILRYGIRWQRIMAIVSSSLASLLYLISEVLPVDYYLYETSAQINLLFRGLTIVSILGPMIFIFATIARSDYIVHKELKELAEKDSLTQIFNRRVLYRAGHDAFKKAKNSSYCFCFMLFDIDFFKKINDQYGHPVGDELLKELTDLVLQNIRKSDLLARYGGEEFAILLDNTDKTEGLVIARKLLEIVEGKVFEIEGHKIKITISIGLLQYKSDFNSFDEMMKDVDGLLYQAKEKGRNQIQSATRNDFQDDRTKQ
ncbi:GGDEF domain-containing protein [Eubacteriaceae bacterium ES2]|nr:GGDEF domain-containing protein [Eubacteriaceae bacterium ES2]